MNDLTLILRFRLRGLLTRWRGPGLQVLSAHIPSLIIFGSFAFGVFLMARATTSYLVYEAHIGLFLYHRFLSMILYVLFVTVNLGNLLVCYATLYNSDEVRFLMALPIRHETVFLVKFLDNFLYSSSTLILLGLSVLIGYGSSLGLPWYFYPFATIVVLLPFLLIAAMSAVILLVLLIKVAARIGIRRLLGILVFLYVGAVYLYFSRTNPVAMVQEVSMYSSTPDAYLSGLDPPFVKYLPNHWVSEFFYWSVIGEPARAIPYLIMLFSALAGLFAVARFLGQQYYYESWLDATDARAMAGRGRLFLRMRMMEFGRKSFFGPKTAVLLRRDFWLFFRDPSQWMHLLLMLVLLVIFLVSLSSLDLRLTQPFLRAVTFLVVFAFCGFLVASVALRFVFPSVSTEGNAFWCIRTAPVRLVRLYWYKFLTMFSLILLLSETLAVGATLLLRQDTSLVLVAAALSGFTALSLTTIHLSGGAQFSSFAESSAIRVASSQGASLTFLLSVLYLAVTASALLVPLVRYFEVLTITGQAVTKWLYSPVIGVGILSLAVFLVTSAAGMRAILREH